MQIWTRGRLRADADMIGVVALCGDRYSITGPAFSVAFSRAEAVRLMAELAEELYVRDLEDGRE